MRAKRFKNCGGPFVAIGTGLGLSLLFAGCMTLEQMAPPVGPRLHTIAASHSMDATLLEFGRHVYLTDCAKCHGVEPIGRYSYEQWREILPRMARETRLDDQRESALEAYVLTAHKALEQSEESD